MSAAQSCMVRSITLVSMVAFAAGCAPVAGAHLDGVRYAGDIRPIQPRPAFAVEPPADSRPPLRDTAMTDDTSDTPSDRGLAERPEPVPPAAARPTPAGPPIDPPFRRPANSRSALAGPGTPNATDRHRSDVPIETVVPAGRGLSLGNGAAGLSAADWAALAALARQQRESGGTLRVEVYRTAEAAEPASDRTDPSLERAQAMAVALARLGVEAVHIAVVTVDRPGGAEDASTRAPPEAPRVFLDTDGTAG